MPINTAAMNISDILDMTEVLPANGKWTVFHTAQDDQGWYEQWCGQNFSSPAEAESFRQLWVKELCAER